MFTNKPDYRIIHMKAGDSMGKIRDNLKRNLGYYLTLKSINQKYLADKLGVSQSAVTNWIKGNNSPDIEILAQICDILHVPVSDLLGTGNNDQLTKKEIKIIEQYRNKPEMQPAIDVLLELNNDNI